MDFSIMLWGHLRDGGDTTNAYRLALELAKLADESGFSAIWIPERHFHPWGGLYPNPAVICAALATVTKRIRLRAGSVVVPLHHPIRIAEEWAVVDNLSGGRVELSIASGWRADDFILAPDVYADRKDAMFEAIEIVQKLWRGDKHAFRNPDGRDVEAEIFPKPVQKELPLWVTSAGSIRTIADAGTSGCGLLTHLLGQSLEDLEKKIVQFRAYRKGEGLPGEAPVSLMLHTFVGPNDGRVREVVRGAMTSYLIESADLSMPADQRANWDALDDALKAEHMGRAFERYYETAGLLGTPASCYQILEKVEKLGVTDVCCLVDFGLPTDVILQNFQFIVALKDAFARRERPPV